MHEQLTHPFGHLLPTFEKAFPVHQNHLRVRFCPRPKVLASYGLRQISRSRARDYGGDSNPAVDSALTGGLVNAHI